ncbi:MAG: NIPSNAP family protein [Bacteroidia bacterium]|nr:NIPSNAP family protein [Bacteroidia bacterium]
MKLLLPLLLLLMPAFSSAQAPRPASDPRCFELRIYQAAPGKMPALIDRFRNHTMALFERHGMVNMGYWLTVGTPDTALVYLLAYPDRAARDAAWKAFGKDPAWKRVLRESERNGPLVDSISSILLHTTDFSPDNFESPGGRFFELRTYEATPHNLGLLLARFRNHTMKLFEKHGMTNLVYWTEDGRDDRLVYLLAHESRKAAAASFDAFRQDPEWLAVREASEKLAAGSLTVSVKSRFLYPLEFSPWK